MAPKAIDTIDGFRFSFYSNENKEPPHVHVWKGDAMAKFWLLPEVKLVENYNFKVRELRKAWNLVEENKVELLKKWYEFFKP